MRVAESTEAGDAGTLLLIHTLKSAIAACKGLLRTEQQAGWLALLA